METTIQNHYHGHLNPSYYQLGSGEWFCYYCEKNITNVPLISIVVKTKGSKLEKPYRQESL